MWRLVCPMSHNVCSKSGHSLCFPHFTWKWFFRREKDMRISRALKLLYGKYLTPEISWKHHIAASSMFQFHQRKFWDISESPRSSFWCVCFDVSTILSVWESGSGINSVHFHIVLKIIMTKLNLYIILKTEKSLIICFVYSNPLKYSVLLNHHMLCLPANSLAISLVSLKSVKH